MLVAQDADGFERGGVLVALQLGREQRGRLIVAQRRVGHVQWIRHRSRGHAIVDNVREDVRIRKCSAAFSGDAIEACVSRRVN